MLPFGIVFVTINIGTLLAASTRMIFNLYSCPSSVDAAGPLTASLDIIPSEYQSEWFANHLAVMATTFPFRVVVVMESSLMSMEASGGITMNVMPHMSTAASLRQTMHPLRLLRNGWRMSLRIVSHSMGRPNLVKRSAVTTLAAWCIKKWHCDVQFSQ